MTLGFTGGAGLVRQRGDSGQYSLTVIQTHNILDCTLFAPVDGHKPVAADSKQTTLTNSEPATGVDCVGREPYTSIEATRGAGIA